jgi:hypothetical protein
MSWAKLSDLQQYTNHRIITVRPRRRTYLRQSEAGYDWAVGREFIVTSENSPHYGNVVAVDERHNLKRSGYTHVHIHYNLNDTPLELEL